MRMGNGATKEGVLITCTFTPERIGALTIYYNGKSITYGPGWMIDTRDYDDILFGVQFGTVLGALATVQNAVYECATDDPSSASAISGADFPDVNTANDERIIYGAVECKNYKRYMCLRTEIIGPATTTPTVDFSAFAILGKATSQKTPATLAFDV